MMRSIHRWLICRAAERAGAPPRLTRHAMAHDATLRAFAQAVASLPHRLRDDAGKLADAPRPAVNMRIESHRPAHPLWALGALGAVAAAVLAIVLPLTIDPGDAPPAQGPVALDLPTTPDAMVHHITLAMNDSLRTQWQRVAADGSALADTMLAPLPQSRQR